MLKGLAAVLAGVCVLASGTAAGAQSRGEVLAAMKRATAFMTDKAAYNGGYVWSYTADFSRRFGELEAKPTMVWVQPPGTATMGHLFLDAYHATGDETYYRAAERAAEALVWGQHPSGGWNYFIDFGGPASSSDWYETYGKNAWRMEEFQHDWGNATFDDAGTSEAMQFLLRLYVEKRDPRWKPALDKALNFVLEAQYPVGGWPQRYPVQPKFEGDYTGYITFNDDVAGENIKFLIMAYQALGDTRVLDPINRAMTSFLVTQLGQPQPGWALQYTLDLRPAAARSYEPLALATHTTASNTVQLMTFYELTGDARFLARVPEALDWLDKVRLPSPTSDGRTHPTFIEIGTDRPLYVHRRGSNVVNGEYYVDYSPERPLAHYSAFRKIDMAGLRARYERLRATPPAQVAKDSPLKAKGLVPLPRYFASRDLETSDLNVRPAGGEATAIDPARVRRLLSALNREGYWPTPLAAASHPYTGEAPPTQPDGDYATTHVGDRTDTSPFPDPNPQVGISTGTYIQNMTVLIDWLDQQGR